MFLHCPLIIQLQILGLECNLHGEFFGCFLYADDILSHTVRAVQMMLYVCDEFADDFDVKFNNSKSVAVAMRVAMRIGNRYSERCVSLQMMVRIRHVNELKYLGVFVICAKYLKFSVEHLRQKFYRMFNCVYSKSKAANSEMVTVQLLKSYCLPSF